MFDAAKCNVKWSSIYARFCSESSFEISVIIKAKNSDSNPFSLHRNHNTLKNKTIGNCLMRSNIAWELRRHKSQWSRNMVCAGSVYYMHGNKKIAVPCVQRMCCALLSRTWIRQRRTGATTTTVNLSQQEQYTQLQKVRVWLYTISFDLLATYWLDLFVLWSRRARLPIQFFYKFRSPWQWNFILLHFISSNTPPYRSSPSRTRSQLPLRFLDI